jgi:uncharacterized protein
MEVALGLNDSLYAVSLDGESRGEVKMFLSAPIEGEITGPAFNTDFEALFVSIQHPAVAHNWPDGDFAKPSVIVVTKEAPGNKRIGS